jgi:hypothetical protein
MLAGHATQSVEQVYVLSLNPGSHLPFPHIIADKEKSESDTVPVAAPPPQLPTKIRHKKETTTPKDLYLDINPPF